MIEKMETKFKLGSLVVYNNIVYTVDAVYSEPPNFYNLSRVYPNSYPVQEENKIHGSKIKQWDGTLNHQP